MPLWPSLDAVSMNAEFLIKFLIGYTYIMY